VELVPIPPGEAASSDVVAIAQSSSRWPPPNALRWGGLLSSSTVPRVRLANDQRGSHEFAERNTKVKNIEKTQKTQEILDSLTAKFGPPHPVPNLEPLPIWSFGDIFTVDNAYYTPSEDGNGHFTLVVHNRSGKWVDVVIDRSGGVSKTGHIEDGADGGFVEATQLYVQRDNKLTRWRPGLFEIPGNGGGEIHFAVPADTLNVILEITVRG
jgi:hypothetical protein